MNRKIICTVIALLLLMPLLFACGDGKDESTGANSGDGNMTPFGLEKKNWGGETVVFTTVGEGHDTYSDIEIAAKGTTGSYVNDASYQRYLKIQEDYGINIEVEYQQSGEADAVKNAILANTCDFDVIVNSVLNLSDYALEGLLYDLADIKSLNLENAWWDQSSIRDLSVKNHVFFVSGDLLVSDKGATWITFFNKNMYETYFPGDDSLYDIVKSGDWTIDKLYELSKVVSEGNKSISDLNKDNGTFGLITQTYDGIACMMGFGQKMIAKDGNDCFILNIDNDATKTKFLGLFDVMEDNITSLIAEIASSGQGYPAIPNNANAVFQSGRGLFQFNKVGYVQALSDANLDFQYGVLPLPKYDSTQDNYYSPTTVYWSLFVALPSTTQESRLDLIAYTLEAMGYYGKELLQPAYYDITIKSQKMTDGESEEMLDLVFSNRIWDPAAAYDFGDSLYMYTTLITSNNNGIASAIESKSPGFQTSIDSIMEQIDILEQQQNAKSS